MNEVFAGNNNIAVTNLLDFLIQQRTAGYRVNPIKVHIYRAGHAPGQPKSALFRSLSAAEERSVAQLSASQGVIASGSVLPLIMDWLREVVECGVSCIMK